MFHARSFRWVLVSLATVMALVGGLVVADGFMHPSGGEIDCSRMEADSFDAAGALARACGVEAEVVSERTPWHTSWATPGGETRLEASALPHRVMVDGRWAQPDPTIVSDADGVRVAASVYPMSFNPGGVAGAGKPLGTITRDGHVLAVRFPLELPPAVVSASQLSYPLADGVRLVVTVSTDLTGFLPVVELADAGAAERFAKMLADAGDRDRGFVIGYTTELSDGLRLEADDEGAVHVLDAEGETQFLTPTPVMWDSSGTQPAVASGVTEVGVIDRTQAPAGGDRIAPMGVAVEGSTIEVTPDAEMLADPGTAWPVYLDPGFSGWGASSWIAVRKGGYTSTLYNWGDISASMPGQGTGYCNQVASCNVVFYQRVAWQFTGLTTLASLAGADVTSAQFRVNGVHSFNCTAQTANLYRTSTFSSGTNWAGLSWLQFTGSRTESQRPSCATDGYREFDATAAARWAADNSQTTLPLGIAVDESNMNGWKRFRADATLAVTYNRAPSIPTGLQLTSPVSTGCVTGASRPMIASTKPTVSAISSDPDGGNVYTSFEVATASNLADVRWSSGNLAAVASGSRQSAVVTSGLADGGVYAWRARTTDGALYSPWSSWCEFGVDVTAPVAPSITPVADATVQAVYAAGTIRGGVGQLGKFTFSSGASTDVVAFDYGFNAPTAPIAAPASNGTATVSYTPTTTGVVTLTVRARDAAGNISPAQTFTFTVATPTEDGVWLFDEGVGTVAADAAGSPSRPMSVSGATWGDGPHALFDSRAGDHALLLNGTSSSAYTNGPVVNTATSFTVSAFVRLDPASAGQGSFTALAQDGVRQSGFRLGYSSSCATSSAGCWTFAMPDTANGTGQTVVESTVPVASGEWVFLLAEHDVSTQAMRLWVCDIGTPDAPAVGDPVRSETSRSATPWAASGALTVGRALSSGASTAWWPGAIDDVRVFSGKVVSEPKIRRMCQGAEASDFGGNQLSLDPTTVVGQ